MHGVVGREEDDGEASRCGAVVRLSVARGTEGSGSARSPRFRSPAPGAPRSGRLSAEQRGIRSRRGIGGCRRVVGQRGRAGRAAEAHQESVYVRPDPKQGKQPERRTISCDDE